jgi:protein-disulfide isomerase
VGQIEKEYVDTGKVKYVMKNFPLESIHRSAFKLAEAAECAGEQGKFWEMRDYFFTNQKTVKLEELPQYAENLGLNRGSFEQCLESGKYAPFIRSDMEEGQKASIRSIPSFLLGFPEGDDKVRAVKLLKGAQPFAAFKGAIDGLLAEEKE